MHIGMTVTASTYEKILAVTVLDIIGNFTLITKVISITSYGVIKHAHRKGVIQ